MDYIIYNLAGLPGDLYQLVPDKFLATLAACLNQGEPGSAEVWDRSNLDVAAQLAPEGILGGLLRRTGHHLFQSLWAKGCVPKPLGLAFRGLDVAADRGLSRALHRLTERDAERILREDPQAVFVNLRHGPGFAESLRLAERLKAERPGLRLIGIGHRASWFARELAAACPQFDAFVVGPSQYHTMVALARGAPPVEMTNTVCREGGRVVATERAFHCDPEHGVRPDYSAGVYRGVEGQLPFREVVLANEACPFSCHFCIRPVTYGTRWKARDAARVVDEVEGHVQAGIRCFRFSDSTPPPGMLTAVADEILARGLDETGLHISSFGRLNRHMREDYETLRRAGFEALFFGVESGSPRMLRDVLGKRITVDEIRKTVPMVHAAGIRVVASFIFPAPGETQESRQETLDLLADLKPYLSGALVQPAGVYPGTPWHTEADRFGVHLDQDYVRRAVTYPIEPLKPLRFWQPFPFSYCLMGKPAPDVAFQDIVACFNDFSRQVWGREENGGLGIANVQDYGFVLASALGLDPVDFSRRAIMHMVSRDVRCLADLLNIRQGRVAPHSSALRTALRPATTVAQETH